MIATIVDARFVTVTRSRSMAASAVSAVNVGVVTCRPPVHDMAYVANASTR